MAMNAPFCKLATASWCDMLQVIFNLLGNALKFTTEGYIRVAVKPLPAAGVGMDMVQLSVEDTGCGIAKDKQKLIFEAFGQVRAIPCAGCMGLECCHWPCRQQGYAMRMSGMLTRMSGM